MSVIPFQPIGATVIVIPAQSQRPETESGIVLADVEYNPETSGTVVAVGSQFRCAACECEREAPFAIGDRVLFGRGAGMDIDGAPFNLRGETFVLLQEAEILAVLDETAVCEVV